MKTSQVIFELLTKELVDCDEAVRIVPIHALNGEVRIQGQTGQFVYRAGATGWQAIQLEDYRRRSVLIGGQI
jgi:hypothetical protein